MYDVNVYSNMHIISASVNYCESLCYFNVHFVFVASCKVHKTASLSQAQYQLFDYDLQLYSIILSSIFAYTCIEINVFRCHLSLLGLLIAYAFFLSALILVFSDRLRYVVQSIQQLSCRAISASAEHVLKPARKKSLADESLAGGRVTERVMFLVEMTAGGSLTMTNRPTALMSIKQGRAPCSRRSAESPQPRSAVSRNFSETDEQITRRGHK